MLMLTMKPEITVAAIAYVAVIGVGTFLKRFYRIIISHCD